MVRVLRTIRGHGRTFDRRRRVKSSPPGTKSMTMYKSDESWKLPHRLMMKGCWTHSSMCCSLLVC
jgi:hypothetical protein